MKWKPTYKYGDQNFSDPQQVFANLFSWQKLEGSLNIYWKFHDRTPREIGITAIIPARSRLVSYEILHRTVSAVDCECSRQKTPRSRQKPIDVWKMHTEDESKTPHSFPPPTNKVECMPASSLHDLVLDSLRMQHTQPAADRGRPGLWRHLLSSPWPALLAMRKVKIQMDLENATSICKKGLCSYKLTARGGHPSAQSAPGYYSNALHETRV